MDICLIYEICTEITEEFALGAVGVVYASC